MSSDTTTSGADWTFIVLGTQRIPVHCGQAAFDEDLGEWLCASCNAVTHVRDIPGWRPRNPTETP